jgi:hypothetical protein
VQAIAVTRQGLADTVSCLDARRDLFLRDGQGEADFPGRNGRLALWQDWQGFLDRDGQEAAGNAVPAGLDAFRHSWRRPKWHVLVQNTPLAAE